LIPLNNIIVCVSEHRVPNPASCSLMSLIPWLRGLLSQTFHKTGGGGGHI